MPPPITHRSLLIAAQRALASAQLDWLRYGRIDDDFQARAARLSSGEGAAYFNEARQQGSYSALEMPLVRRQLAYLAAQDCLLEARAAHLQLMAAPIPLGHGRESLPELITQLSRDTADEATGEPRDRALATALEPLALRWVELRGRASTGFAEQLASAAEPPGSEPPAAALPWSAAQPASKAPSQAAPHESAAAWLDATDDAAREMVRWLTRAVPNASRCAWRALFSALRATHLDGLARPTRRLFRLAAGARRLGFERELTSHVRAESSVTWFAPSARVVALAVPDDIRVVQPSLEFGVMSDLIATEATGEALALALVSRGQSELVRLPCASGVSSAIGGLFLQLRAESKYLSQLDALSPDVSERLARHAAIFVLLRTRLDAALLVAEQAYVRSDRDRLEQLSMAAERALGCPVPACLAALAFFASPPQAQAFQAGVSGLALHAALRERFDEDWYVNPRVSEVLRGACARGNLLTAPELCAELAAGPELAVARQIEILG